MLSNANSARLAIITREKKKSVAELVYGSGYYPHARRAWDATDVAGRELIRACGASV